MHIRKRKGQMEMMGLAIIVILVSLALLFGIRFAISKGADRKETFTQEQISENMLNALMLSTTKCGGNDMTELLQDCAGLNDTGCGRYDSCKFFNETARGILDGTLDGWGKNYRLTVVSSTRTISSVASGECRGSLDQSEYPIPSKVGGPTLFATLQVCEK